MLAVGRLGSKAEQNPAQTTQQAKSWLDKCCKTRALEGRLINLAKQIARDVIKQLYI